MTLFLSNDFGADNRPPEVISAILQLEIDAMVERRKMGSDLFAGVAEDGPAFGMIGTLIGLVIVLVTFKINRQLVLPWRLLF